MATGIVKERNLEKQIQKQMGCMAGFLQIFDRHHIFTGKRLYSAKRLPPSPDVDTTSETEKSSPLSTELRPVKAAELPRKPSLPPPSGSKEGTSKSSSREEAPRLSLDSRDAKGGLHHPKEIPTTRAIISLPNRRVGGDNDAIDGSQGRHRSPSVIARLMGLDDPLPNSQSPELRRSASESRVSKDLFQSRFIAADGRKSYSNDNEPIDVHRSDPINLSSKYSVNSTQPHRKSFFDSGDIFPEQKQTVSIYSEIENHRIKRRGIEDDLETLKQILEAMQLKGLLQSKQQPSPKNQIRHRTFVYDESPIVLMKTSRPSPSSPINRKMANDYSPSNGRNQIRGVRRYSETSPAISPRRKRNVRSPTRSSSAVKPKPLSVEARRRGNELLENRKGSPVRSPKLNTRRTGQDPTVSNRSPRSGKSTSEIRRTDKITTVVVAEDESSSISGSSSITTSTDTEINRCKGDEYRVEEKNLLKRCDQLLDSIVEMGAADTQPSPVSVLASSFYKDESLTPSPVTTKRNIDFKDQSSELEEEISSPVISPIRTKHIETSDDCDYAYILDILRAFHYLPEKSDIFLLLENQQYLEGKDTSKVSMLQRKLVFDTIKEILDRNKQLPIWRTNSNNGNILTPSIDKVWSEFQRIRECGDATDDQEDLFQTICCVMKKDMARDSIDGWGGYQVEMSEAGLDIERLIIKDLVCEITGDLTVVGNGGTLSSMMPWRRKLVF